MFINGASAISPLPVFDALTKGINFEFLTAAKGRVAEPDYSNLIDPKLIRRMSRIIRMGVVTALDALKQAAIANPDAILTGTAFGCLEDTGVFLKRLVENKEEMLTPTAFIQSTHNTVGAQVALLLKCHSYNNTYVQRAHSFELSLLDAQLWLTEHAGQAVLVGAADELTDYSYSLLERFGTFKHQCGGEGAAYFLVQSAASASSWAEIETIHTLYQPTEEELLELVRSISAPAKEQPVDLILSGEENHDEKAHLYKNVKAAAGDNIPVVNYKQFCGTYPTASAFACWLGAYWLKTGTIPAGWGPVMPAKRILIYQTDNLGYHSLILLKAC